MIVLKMPNCNFAFSNDGCGCDIYDGSGDCRNVDDGGCGCDD